LIVRYPITETAIAISHGINAIQLLKKLLLNSSIKSEKRNVLPSLTSLINTLVVAVIAGGIVTTGRQNKINSRFRRISFQKCVYEINRYPLNPFVGGGPVTPFPPLPSY
jgi:hypothetical protein